MISLKTPEELEKMAKGGRILSEVMWQLKDAIKAGITEIEIDKLAEKLIIKKGAEPGFKRVDGYKHTICVSTNDVVVHGIPTAQKLKKGDIIGIDCGVYLDGFHTDMSETFLVGDTRNAKVQTFLDTGKIALNEAIKQAKIGNHVGDISKTIQNIVEKTGYSVVESLVGHGVGKDLHEEPEVPGYLVGNIKDTPLLKEGMVIAIEVIYNMGGPDLVYANKDGWTLKTKDGSLGGLYERTVAITRDGVLMLTP